MTEMECSKCEHEWDYSGDREPPAYVTCPNCFHRNPLPDAEADSK